MKNEKIGTTSLKKEVNYLFVCDYAFLSTVYYSSLGPENQSCVAWTSTNRSELSIIPLRCLEAISQ